MKMLTNYVSFLDTSKYGTPFLALLLPLLQLFYNCNVNIPTSLVFLLFLSHIFFSPPHVHIFPQKDIGWTYAGEGGWVRYTAHTYGYWNTTNSADITSDSTFGIWHYHVFEGIISNKLVFPNRDRPARCEILFLGPIKLNQHFFGTIYSLSVFNLEQIEVFNNLF